MTNPAPAREYVEILRKVLRETNERVDRIRHDLRCIQNGLMYTRDLFSYTLCEVATADLDVILDEAKNQVCWWGVHDISTSVGHVVPGH